MKIDNNQRNIIAWACLRVNFLDSLQRFEDSYAVSQEFCEWTTSYLFNPDVPDKAILKVPILNKDNRTN